MRKRTGNKGFTLIEVVVSVVLVAIVAASFLGMFTSGYDNIFSMGRRSVATRIAEDFLSSCYAGKTPEDSIAIITTKVNNEYGPNRYQVEQTNTTDPASSLKSITVTVYYRNGTRSINLTALIP